MIVPETFGRKGHEPPHHDRGHLLDGAVPREVHREHPVRLRGPLIAAALPAGKKEFVQSIGDAEFPPALQVEVPWPFPGVTYPKQQTHSLHTHLSICMSVGGSSTLPGNAGPLSLSLSLVKGDSCITSRMGGTTVEVNP